MKDCRTAAPSGHRRERHRHAVPGALVGRRVPPQLEWALSGQFGQPFGQEHQAFGGQSQPGEERIVEDEDDRQVGVGDQWRVVLVAPEGPAVLTPVPVTGGARRSRSGEEDGVVGFLCRAGSVQALASWDQVGVVALALHAADPVRPALSPMSAPVTERALTDTGNGMSFGVCRMAHRCRIRTQP